MNYITLGNSHLRVSQITFGAWAIGGWMWGGADEKDALAAIGKCLDLGITSIDTAAVYGFGRSEEIVGKAIKGKRDKFQIFTKYGLNWHDKKGDYYFSTQKNDGTPVDIYRYASKESVIKECESSLRNLGTDYIDLYQIHRPNNSVPIAETMEAMDILKSQGKIIEAGVSNFSTEQVQETKKHFNIITNQVAYSMVCRDIENSLVPYCIDNNIGIIAYSPLQRGVLTGKIKPGHRFSPGDTRPDRPHYKEPNLSRINRFLETIKPIADSYNASLAQLVINWTLNRPGISCVLVGARNPAQVEENAKALYFEILDKDLEQINMELEKITIEQ